MKHRNFSLQTVGAASLLTILAVLTLATFALLSMATVRSQQDLAAASAEAVQAYYAADTAAEQWLSALRQAGIPGSYEGSFPISDRQTLETAVELEHKDAYTILRWQAVPIPTHAAEGSLDVWDGQ